METKVLSWKEFAGESSMHGLKNVHRADWSILRRVIWAFLVIAAAVYFIVMAVILLISFFSVELVTNVKLKDAQNLTFPTVTICNRNLWKQSVTYDIDNVTFTQREQDLWLSLLSDLYMFSPDAYYADKYNWSDPFLAGVADLNQTDDNLAALAYTVNDSFIACFAAGAFVPCHTIMKPVKTDAGYCHQLNGDGDLLATHAGMSGGVYFSLNVMPEEYFIGPYSYCEGFWISLHDADTIPLMTELCHGVTSGYETSMVITKTEVKRHPPPADHGQSDCYDTETLRNKLHGFTNYSLNACYAECKTAFVINQCGCRDILQPSINNTRLCTIKEMLECSNPALMRYMAEPEHRQSCKCRSTCHEVMYDAKLSLSRYPNKEYQKFVPPGYRTVPAENIALVMIYYGQMSYQTIEEMKAYKTGDIIANLGGMVGLCMGASLLTLAEFLEYAILSISAALSKSASSNKTTPVKLFKDPHDNMTKTDSFPN